MFVYFIEKFFLESDFQILAKIEMTRNKNRLFGRHFETVQHFDFFFQNFFFTDHTYMVTKFRWKSGFPWTPPPLAPTGVKVPWSLQC